MIRGADILSARYRLETCMTCQAGMPELLNTDTASRVEMRS